MNLPELMAVAKLWANCRKLLPRDVLIQYCDIAYILLKEGPSGKLSHLEVYSAVLAYHAQHPCLGGSSCIYSQARNMSGYIRKILGWFRQVATEDGPQERTMRAISVDELSALQPVLGKISCPRRMETIASPSSSPDGGVVAFEPGLFRRLGAKLWSEEDLPDDIVPQAERYDALHDAMDECIAGIGHVGSGAIVRKPFGGPPPVNMPICNVIEIFSSTEPLPAGRGNIQRTVTQAGKRIGKQRQADLAEQKKASKASKTSEASEPSEAWEIKKRKCRASKTAVKLAICSGVSKEEAKLAGRKAYAEA
jgi:hypothetical protein